MRRTKQESIAFKGFLPSRRHQPKLQLTPKQEKNAQSAAPRSNHMKQRTILLAVRGNTASSTAGEAAAGAGGVAVQAHILAVVL